MPIRICKNIFIVIYQKERTGFEPANAFTLTVFKTVAIDHSATSPNYMGGEGFEPPTHSV